MPGPFGPQAAFSELSLSQVHMCLISLIDYMLLADRGRILRTSVTFTVLHVQAPLQERGL